MKTIRQIADEIGVSKTAIRNKLTPEMKTKFAETIGNTVYINEQGETLLKSEFFKLNANIVSANLSETNANQTETVSELVSTLKSELETKNKQIADLTALLATAQEQAASATRAFETAQQMATAAQALHAGTLQQLIDKGEVATDEQAPSIPERKLFGFFQRKTKH